MATRENPDAIEVDVSEVNTSDSSNTKMTGPRGSDTGNVPKDGGVHHPQEDRSKKKHQGTQITSHKNPKRSRQGVTIAADMPCPATIKNMERCLDAYYTKADTMELAYEHLLIVDPNHTARWEKEVNEVHTIREAMKDKWLPIIARATSPLSQPLRRDGLENLGKIKIRADLKPRELSEDSSPVEFSTWCEEYTIYHSASNLQMASKREQQINLHSHINEALRQRLKAEVCHETPVMEQTGKLQALWNLRRHSSCISALAELFRRNNLIFKRRQDLMNMTPSKGEKFLAYMRRVRAHSLECALQEMKNTNLITQIVLMHCPVEEIRKDAKKEKDLDWQKMTAIAEEYDRMNIGESAERANYVSRNNKRPNKEGQNKRQDKPNNQAAAVPQQLQGKCYICGKDGHSTKDCRVSKTVECNACKKRCHLKVACMTELRKQGGQKPREQKARTVQEETDSSTGDDDNFEKVDYVSHARDRGTKAPLLNM